MSKPHDWPASLASTDAVAILVAAIMRDRRAGVQRNVLVSELEESYGLTTEQANALLSEAGSVAAHVSRPTRQRGSARLKWGAAVLLLGIVLTSLSELGVLATPGPGRYYMATGAILFGVFTLVRGLIDLARASN